MQAAGRASSIAAFSNPRLEGAPHCGRVIDGVEMTSWGDLTAASTLLAGRLVSLPQLRLYGGRRSGTDKMTAVTAVGTVRTNARPRARPRLLITRGWMEAVRRGETFVTYGPLLDFAVEGRPAGARSRCPQRRNGECDLASSQRHGSYVAGRAGG